MVVHRVLHYSRKLASLGKQSFILQTELTKRVLNTQAATGMNLNQESISKPSHAISKLEENEGFPPIHESYLICSNANFEIIFKTLIHTYSDILNDDADEAVNEKMEIIQI